MDKKEGSDQRTLQEMSLLFEITQTLDQNLDIHKSIQPLLRLIAERTGMLRGTITLLNRETGQITIESAYGLTEAQIQRGRYSLGEGITGKVVQTGKPMVIPHVSEEPMFLNRTGARGDAKKRDISFVCVPIKSGADIIGALSVDKLFDESVDLDEDVRLLTIVASLLARAVMLRQSLQEERQRLLTENAELQERLKDRFKPSNIIGNSRVMQESYDLIAQVSKSDATVLIRGESGTGKELVAQAIHYNSHRSERAFIKVNLAALPESVIESELFGHEKGSFTGALSTRKGRFEIADGGTIFLDEIGELSPLLQVKLLRVLQEKEFERVGGNETIRVNVRIIAATNAKLEELMAKNIFREDLYYRLNVFPIYIPPLRERETDILLLADYFVEKYAKKNHKSVQRISTPAINLLMSYHWPGNVRELENCIERAVLLSSDEVIHAFHLPPTLQSAESTGTKLRGTLDEAVEDLEREMISEALKTARGNMTKAAEELGITERIMGLRIKKYAINPKVFKGRE